MGESIKNAIAIQSVTYTFMSTATTSTLGGTLSAALVQYNKFDGTYTTVQSLGTVSIPAPDTWSGSLSYGGNTAATYQQSFDLSFTDTANLNPSATYVILLTNTTTTLVGDTPTSIATSFGLGAVTTTLTGTGVADLGGGLYQNGTDGLLYNPGSNWTFSDVSFVPSGNTIPSPEPTTVAAMAGLVLVAGLVFFRLRQRQGTQAAFATIA
jgi:hypothetical protein